MNLAYFDFRKIGKEKEEKEEMVALTGIEPVFED
jgi:hypothetical protein